MSWRAGPTTTKICTARPLSGIGATTRHPSQLYSVSLYERGSSRIQRRFTVLHEFKIAGAYTIRLKLKKKNKVIISAQVSLQINQGVRDPGL